MPRYLALEWDSREARIVIANSKANRVVVSEAFAVNLGPKDPGQTFVDPNVGLLLSDALKNHNTGRCKTLLALGRAGIELKPLSLPPAPDEELPDMVRFAAMREFTQLDEHWPLDYIKTSIENVEGQIGVLAAAISPELKSQILGTCETAGIKPSSLTLRPSAAASLLQRQAVSGDQHVRLLVDLLSEEADMTALVDDRIVFMRTARLPSTYPVHERNAMLLTELRRTMAAVLNQLDGHRVESIFLCGNFEGQTPEELQASMQSEFDLEINLFDPFSGFELENTLSQNMPDHTGRFAPLLGMLLDEVENVPHAIDFLNVKKRPEPQNKKRTIVIAAAAAAVIVLGLLILHFVNLSKLDSQIVKKNKELKSATLDQQVKEAERIQKHVGAIERWKAKDATLIDVLYNISDKAPPGEEVILKSLLSNTTNSSKDPKGNKGAKLVLDGFAMQESEINDMEDKIRANGHEVTTGNVKDDVSSMPPYRIDFGLTVILKAEEFKKRMLPLEPPISPPTTKTTAKTSVEEQKTTKTDVKPKPPVENAKTQRQGG